MAAISKDWLERFEPLRPFAATRFTLGILCRDRGTRAEVVVRELRPSGLRHAGERQRALEVMAAEAEALAALHRESAGCFPALIDTGLESPSPWLAVERCDGPTLSDLFLAASRHRPAEGAWTLPRAIAALLSLRPGLLALHRRGVAHGRIHPGVLVVENGAPMADPPDAAASAGPPAAVADFADGRRLRLADAGWAAAPRGVPLLPDDALLPFLAPAAIERPGPPEPWTDAWSLAAILGWCVSGRAPIAPPPGPLGHARRAAARRGLRAGADIGWIEALPGPVGGLLRDVLKAGGAAAPTETEPLAPFFEALTRGLEAARADRVWSVAPLPDPDLAALRLSLRRPPSREILAQHDEAWRRWRSAARRMLDAFDALEVSGRSSSFAALRDEFEPLAAECLQRQAGDDPARVDADLMPDRLREIQEQVGRLDRLAATGLRTLHDGLAAAGRDLDGTLAAAEPGLRTEIDAFRHQIERLGTEPPSVELFVAAALLCTAADRLSERAAVALAGARREDAAAAFDEAVRREAWADAAAVLERWPAEDDPGAGGRAAALAAWRSLAAPMEALLTRAPTSDSARLQSAAAARLASEAPAGFEAAAAALADRLRRPIAAARETARRAVEEAGREAAAHAPAAERAAERSLLEGCADRAGAETFCRALERLEKESAAAAARLDAEPADPAALFAIPGRLETARRAATEARHAWWPHAALPLARREWEAWSERAQRLLRRGERGLRQAREMLEKEVPRGWEEAARRMIEPAAAPAGDATAVPAARQGASPAGHVATAVSASAVRPKDATVSIAADVTAAAPAPPAARHARAAGTATVVRTARDAVVAERRRIPVRALSIGAALTVVAAIGIYVALGPGREAGRPVQRTGAPAPARPVAGAEAWIHGPALPDLTLKLTPDGGTPSSTTLPGRVPYAAASKASFELTWSDGATVARRAGRVASVTPESLQAEVDAALASAPTPAGASAALDQAVTTWAAAVLGSGP